MTFLFNPLLILFGIGVRKVAEKRSLRFTGNLLIVWGLLGFVWLFFPMHMRGAIGSTTDTMHLVLAGVTVSLMALFIGFGSGAKGKGFRLYSILTILTMLIFGALVGQQAPRVAAQLSTPWMGVMERVSVYAPMLWVFFLAIVLLTQEKTKLVGNKAI
jgi:K+-transporting ATPase A subunit